MTLASMARKHEPRKVPTGARAATSAMIASLAAEGYDTVATPFGHALVELARTDARIVGLSADLAKYTDLHVFAGAMPDRFYQMGMAEQVLISAAAGLAREGNRGTRDRFRGRLMWPIRDLSGDRTLVKFGTGDEVTVQAGPEGIRFLLISGAPIEEPVAWHGPIVMNTDAEIRQAMTDLRNGTFIKPAH